MSHKENIIHLGITKGAKELATIKVKLYGFWTLKYKDLPPQHDLKIVSWLITFAKLTYIQHRLCGQKEGHKTCAQKTPPGQPTVVLWVGSRMDKEKSGNLGLVKDIKDFSTQTSVQGEVTYVFHENRGFFDYLLWPFVLLGFLTVVVFLLQVSIWSENPIKTYYKEQKEIFHKIIVK